jgi:hypothetical protein
MTDDSDPSPGTLSTDAEGRPVRDATRSKGPAADNIIEEVPKQKGFWPSTNALEAVEVAFQKLQRPEVSNGGPERRSSLIDPIRVPEVVSALSHEMRVRHRDEFRAVSSSPSAVLLRRAIVAGALIAAFGLGWAGGSRCYDFLALAPASAPIENTSDCWRHSGRETVCVTSKSDREIAPAGVSVSKGPLPNQRNASSSTSAAVATQDRWKSSPRLTPVPETRPTTIEGWMVREVVGGKVVLEGPNGSFNATRGDTVPGVGRIDSIVRWGNRLIVATSRGLISTEN